MNCSKIKSIAKIKQIAAGIKDSGKEIVFTNGCFDILHIGHIKILKKAKSLGDVLIVGLNSDSSIKRIKGSERPVVPEKDRAAILSSISFVDYVVVFSSLTPYELIKNIKPDVLVKGSDWKNGKIIGAEFSGRVVRIPLVSGRSTTGLIEKIKKL
ncbi:MAG: Bifunctional protein HldE [Elusimicrobia bacterium ADurb.Bin231]|nr:MAG: Bifunctional protein HldE [Elusimicrobia bacterium ADurb.Bin231]